MVSLRVEGRQGPERPVPDDEVHSDRRDRYREHAGIPEVSEGAGMRRLVDGQT